MDGFMKNFNGIKFKGTFREYQQKVLDSANKHLKDGKVHIIAAPGSGKTILGCELIRRLNEPCLIFSPTVTIREQWGDRFKNWFLNGEEQYSELVSYDLFNVKLINSLTYQALYSAIEKIEVHDDDEDCDYKEIDLFELMKTSGIKTICLDEAHHLKNEWQKALEKFINKLDKGIKIISLTATPPYDSSEAEWKRYINVCGEIDEEIFVPELVKQNTLCPHQDYIYFSYPTTQESEEYKNHKLKAQKAVLEISELKCFEDLYKYLVENYEKLYSELCVKQKELTSLFVFFEYCKIKIHKKHTKLLTGQELLPNYTMEHADSAINYILSANFVTEEIKKSIIDILKSHGLYENKKASILLSEKLKKTLTASMSKLDSITKIVEVENASLRESLRLLILTDFIKKDSLSNINTDKSFDNISVVSIFEVLRRSNNSLRLGVLSGAVVILPTDIEELLKTIIKLKESDFSRKEIQGTEYSLYTFKGGNKSKVKYVSELFELGHINILVGTKSLLGEGWDSPCINSLILASFIGSFVLSNQMRGRAIRIYKNSPNKCSNIWHLVTLEPNFDNDKNQKLQSYDYNVLERRFKTFVGPNYLTGKIESGIERISNVKPPINVDNVQGVNKSMEILSQDRENVKKQWLGIAENSEVCVDTQIPKSKRMPSFVASGICILLFILLMEILLGFVVAHFTGFLKIIVGLIYFVISVNFVRCFIKTLLKVVRHATAKSSIKTLSCCLLKSLQKLNEISLNCKLKILKEDKFISVILIKASLHEQKIFNKCLVEFFTCIDSPRYILVYKNALNVRNYKRSYICPNVFDENKKRVQVLIDSLKSKSTKFEAIYIKNEHNMFNLRKCRTESYLFDCADEIKTKQRVVQIKK